MRAPAAVLVASILLVAGAVPSPAGERDVRRDVQRALAQKDPRVRVGAVDTALRDADDASAAAAVVELVLAPDAPQALLDVGTRALGAMASAAAQDVIEKAAAAGNRFRRLMIAEALGKGSTAPGRMQLSRLAVADDARVRAAALTSLGDRREPESALTLTTALDDPEWTVRSAAIRGLRLVGDAKTIPFLTERMRREDGRLLDDLADACADLTGKRLGPDPAAYERAAGTTAGAAWTAPPPTIGTALFQTRSRRVLFVLSTGDTMKDEVQGLAADTAIVAGIAKGGADLADAISDAKTKIDGARTHLRGMLRTLSDGVDFDVLSYANSPTFAFGQLTRSDDASRRKAEARIARVSAGGMADIHDALHRVFDVRGKDPFDAPDAADTVVFLSDGVLPTNGFSDRTEIAQRAARWNRARQIRFVCVGVGQTEPYVLGTLSGGPPPGVFVSVP